MHLSFTIETNDNGRNPNVYSLTNECVQFDVNVFAANSLTSTTFIVGSACTQLALI
jgi:hypothetical protein